MPTIEIIGVYPVDAPEPVHLVEVQVRDACGIFKVGDFTQKVDNQPRSDWQVPFMENILNQSGDKILADDLSAPKRSELWQNNVRMAFFFHYLDFKRPFMTPFGDVRLPSASALPERLSMIQYEQP